MELFKKILQHALTHQAAKIDLSNNKSAQITLTNGQIEDLEQFGVCTKEYLQELSQKLLGRPYYTESQPLTTKINLGNNTFAYLLFIGESPDISIYLPPTGEKLLHNDLQNYQQQANRSTTPSKPQAQPHIPPPLQETPPSTKETQQPPASSKKIIYTNEIRTTASEKVRQVHPIDKILVDMVQKRASDLHLTLGEPIVMRIDGEIMRMNAEPISPEYMESLLDPIIPERNREEFLKRNDTDFAYELKGVGRFRVNMFRDRMGVGAVLRHIPSNILTVEQLNLPKAVIEFCHLTKGLVLVTGPTGSGKSTTLAAMIDYINKTRRDHILTIEDPIEFVHPQQKCLVNQREIGRHTDSFAAALRAALREDPDVILIGEMRDLETISTAIETAETGHLVFGTLHTNTAVSTVDRIIDMFPAERQSQIRVMLASSLKGVVSQTLLKKKGGGRIAALEVFVPDDACANMIREGKIHMIPNHMTTQRAKGNQLLNDVLVSLVREGIVDINDAFMKAVDKKSFLTLARAAGLKTDGFDAEKGITLQQAMNIAQSAGSAPNPTGKR